MTNLTNKRILPEDFKKCVEGYEHTDMDLINQKVRCKGRYKHAMPDTMDRQLKDWVVLTGGKGSLYVHGSVGTGKTHSVSALAKLLYVNKIKVKMYNVIEFLNEIKALFKYDDGESVIKEMLTTKRTLILDDFGAEKGTDWTQEIIYRLVNLRYERLLNTILISNLSLNELSKRYGDRVVSRITEMVGGKSGTIKITGKDRRL